MSHFTVLVIGENPEQQLKPFDENIEVPAYDKGEVSEEEIQNCIRWYVEKRGFKFINNFEELYAKHGSDWNGGTWRKHSDGTWHEWSTRNPQSKWDWYLLGGRWTGLLRVKEKAACEVGRPGIMTAPAEDGMADQARIKDILNMDEILTFAVVKDGKWYERGEMGWFGIALNEKDENVWQEQYSELLRSLDPETLISIYDCHI